MPKSSDEITTKMTSKRVAKSTARGRVLAGHYYKPAVDATPEELILEVTFTTLNEIPTSAASTPFLSILGVGLTLDPETDVITVICKEGLTYC